MNDNLDRAKAHVLESIKNHIKFCGMPKKGTHITSIVDIYQVAGFFALQRSPGPNEGDALLAYGMEQLEKLITPV